MSAPQSYYVPVDAGEAEFTEKRSRFLGHVRRVETEAEARAFLDEMRKKYYDARHNCWCYVLHEGGVVRYGDDGEPQGTAGQPMLNVFQREGVENVVCVVTRYFGGVLLGSGTGVVQQLVAHPGQQGLRDRTLIGKIEVECALAHLGAGGDILHAGLGGAPLQKQLVSCIQKRAALFLFLSFHGAHSLLHPLF